MEYYPAERKKEFLPFLMAWMELDSIMLSEISQAVRDKYHMISPLSATTFLKWTLLSLLEGYHIKVAEVK